MRAEINTTLLSSDGTSIFEAARPACHRLALHVLAEAGALRAIFTIARRIHIG
jgi:hypothetical protein